MHITTEQKVMIGIAIATLVLLIGGVMFISQSQKSEQEKLDKPFLGEKVDADSSVGFHVARGESHPPYSTNPPAAGPHWGDGVAGPGIKDKEVADELLVHSLEHGAVIVWYKSDLPKDQVDQIKEAYNAASGKKIMVPRKRLDVPVALTSWGWILKLKSIDKEKITEFIETNNDRAPEKAPI